MQCYKSISRSSIKAHHKAQQSCIFWLLHVSESVCLADWLSALSCKDHNECQLQISNLVRRNVDPGSLLMILGSKNESSNCLAEHCASLASNLWTDSDGSLLGAVGQVSVYAYTSAFISCMPATLEHELKCSALQLICHSSMIS